MNNNKIKLKKIFGKIINPKRDWNILIILFIFFIIISIGFDFYIYQQIISEDMYISIKKDELIKQNLKSDDLQKILDNFEIKKSNTANLKLENFKNLIDPFL